MYPSECLESVSSQLNMTALGSLGLIVAVILLSALFTLAKRAVTHIRGLELESSGDWREPLLAGIPAALFCVFVFVPSVSRTILGVWSCKQYLYSDDGTSIEFLQMRMTMRCDTEEHDEVVSLAIGYLVVWPICIPLLCLAIVVSCRDAIRSGKPTEWSMATRILHYEYRPEMYYWEAASLAHRLLMSGYVSLIRNSLGVIRLTVALLMSILFASILMLVQPYARFDLNALAIASNLTLTVALLAAVRMPREAHSRRRGLRRDPQPFPRVWPSLA
jgi:hypothetical protein